MMMIMFMWLGAAVNAGPQEKKIDDAAHQAAFPSHKIEKNGESVKDLFFPIARLIMTKEEIKIYKHLTTTQQKLDFIDEFWKKRDPSPGTDENESRDEFYLRVAYANKWFNEGSKDRGWDTDRGRILLQLGFPDKREIRDVPFTAYTGQLLSTKRTPTEAWIYDRYQMVLIFADTDDSGQLRLVAPPSNLGYALDRAKFTMNLTTKNTKSDPKDSFKFDADYKTDHLKISIPVKKVSFEENNDHQMTVDLGIRVYVYRNDKKIDEINIPKSVSLDKDKLLAMKNIEFNIPYKVSAKGKYLFDVVIEEKGSSSMYRDYAKFKI